MFYERYSLPGKAVSLTLQLKAFDSAGTLQKSQAWLPAPGLNKNLRGKLIQKQSSLTPYQAALLDSL